MTPLKYQINAHVHIYLCMIRDNIGAMSTTIGYTYIYVCICNITYIKSVIYVLLLIDLLDIIYFWVDNQFIRNNKDLFGMLEYAAFILALQFLRISKAHLLLLNLVLQIMCYFSTPNKLKFFFRKKLYITWWTNYTLSVLYNKAK